MKDQEKKEFTVTDRRVKLEDEHSPSDKSGSRTDVSASGSSPEPTCGPFTLPEMNFASFLISLNTSALIHLGLLPDPVNKKVEPNMELAKQVIDLLGILKEKTKGNLNQEEQDLLDNLLYDLRLKFVELCKREGGN